MFLDKEQWRTVRLLELSDSRKEVVLMVAGKSVVSAALRELDRVCGTTSQITDRLHDTGFRLFRNRPI